MKKAIKKIVALGIGVAMLGATVTGAADLNDYPAPFIQNGKFSGTLVVGDNAAAEDVVGVSDIAMSLQYAASVKAGTGSSATTTVSGDAFEIDDSGDALNLFQTLDTVVAILDDGDLNALADGTFKAKTTVSYTQTLSVPDVEVQFTTNPDDETEDPELFLYFDSGNVAIDYELAFTTSPESDNTSDAKYEDWEDEKLTLLGKEYTITKAEDQAGGTSGFELTLMAGAVQDTLEVGQTKTYTINGKDYEVTVMVVSGDSSANALTKMIINDEVTKSVSKDETYTLKDGIDVGIKEILPTKSGDVVQNLVEFYLGAEKLVIDGKNSKMEVGDEAISDVSVSIQGEKSADLGKLSTLGITFTPTEAYYVPVGGTLSEALVDNSDYTTFINKLGVDFQFEGLDSANTETVKFSPSGKRNYEIEFTNRKGVTYKQKIFYITSSQTDGMAVLGEDANDPLHVVEDETLCDNDYFAVENNKNSRILRLMDVSSSDTTVTLKDVGTGDSTEHSWSASGGNNVTTFVMDGASYKLNVTDVAGKCVVLDEITDDETSNRAALWTAYDVEINIYNASELTNSTDGAPVAINITEDVDGQEDDSTTDYFGFNFTYDSSDGLDLSYSTFAPMQSYDDTNVLINLDSDDNVYEGYTQWGNFVRQSSTDNQDKWEIEVSKEEAKAKVFATAGVTSIATLGGEEGDTVILSRINVGATKLASEVRGTEGTANLILVGGPCANAAVEQASGDFPTCSAWPLDPGEALVQLVEQDNGAVALLVAGTMAEDTRAATSLVSEMDKLKALSDGVMKQKLVVASETLSDMVEVMEDDEGDDEE